MYRRLYTVYGLYQLKNLGVQQLLEVTNVEFLCAEPITLSGGEQICCSLQTEAVYFIVEVRPLEHTKDTGGQQEMVFAAEGICNVSVDILQFDIIRFIFSRFTLSTADMCNHLLENSSLPLTPFQPAS